MRKYRWSLLKTLEFLNSRRPELEIRGTFIQQLQDYEQRLIKQNIGPLSSNWTEISLNKVPGIPQEAQHEELILRNTFINAQMGPIAQYLGTMGQNHIKQFQIRWSDEASSNKIPLASEIQERPMSKSNHKIIKATQLKSNLKVKIAAQTILQQNVPSTINSQHQNQLGQNTLNFYSNPDDANDNGTLNDNDAIDGGEIIFPSNNNLYSKEVSKDMRRQPIADGKIVTNIINNNNINNFNQQVIQENPSYPRTVIQIEIRQEPQNPTAVVNQQNSQFSQLSGLSYVRNPLPQSNIMTKDSPQIRGSSKQPDDDSLINSKNSDTMNDSHRIKKESPNNSLNNSHKPKKASKDSNQGNGNMIGSYNPGFGSLKIQNSNKNQIGSQFNDISAGFRMIGQNPTSNQPGGFRSGPIRATAFEQQYQNIQMNNNSDMQFANIGNQQIISGNHKAKQNTGGNLGRPGTAPKRPASPGSQLQQKTDNNYIGGITSTNFQGLSNNSKQRSGSQKPSSAPSKNRLRSNSPSSAVQQEKKQIKNTSQTATNFTYNNTFGTKHLGPHPLYRGYSPSKPKWKGPQQQQPSGFGQQYQASQAMMGGYMRQNSTKNKNMPY